MSDNSNNKSSNKSKKNKSVKSKKKVNYTSTPLTEEEITEYLKDSIKIPKEQWITIPVNSFISYFKNDDSFIKGGFIKLQFNKNDNDYIIYGTKLVKFSNDRYYKEFTINLSNIKEIYKKIDKSAIIEYQIIKNNISTLFNDFSSKFDEILNKLDTHDKKIIKLEENHYKTIKLIKTLHNIKSLDNITK